MFLLAAAATPPKLQSIMMDYPPAAMRRGVEGVVGFEAELTRNGRVRTCRVTRASGDADLDRQTCVQVQRTARFVPATDQDGNAVASTFAGSLRWTITQSD